MSSGSEVEALKSVDSALEPLDDDARSRVLAWALAKFAPALGVEAQSEHFICRESCPC